MKPSELRQKASAILPAFCADVRTLSDHEAASTLRLKIMRRLLDENKEITRSQAQHAAMSAIGFALNGPREDGRKKNGGAGRGQGRKPKVLQ